jgi:hypothetical protein
MFTIHMPADFAPGTTAPVEINGQPRRLRWAEPELLEILPAAADDATPPDARRILIELKEEKGWTFYCSDAD